MAYKRRRKKRYNDDLFGMGVAKGVVGTSLTLGVGASAIGGLPTSSVTSSLSGGITRAAGWMPTFATAGMGMHAMKKVKKFGEIRY